MRGIKLTTLENAAVKKNVKYGKMSLCGNVDTVPRSYNVRHRASMIVRVVSNGDNDVDKDYPVNEEFFVIVHTYIGNISDIGGGIEKGETFFQAANREFHEETYGCMEELVNVETTKDATFYYNLPHYNWNKPNSESPTYFNLIYKVPEPVSIPDIRKRFYLGLEDTRRKDERMEPLRIQQRLEGIHPLRYNTEAQDLFFLSKEELSGILSYNHAYMNITFWNIPRKRLIMLRDKGLLCVCEKQKCCCHL